MMSAIMIYENLQRIQSNNGDITDTIRTKILSFVQFRIQIHEYNGDITDPIMGMIVRQQTPFVQKF